ncbi:MAG: aromatic-amino-acid transaminase [Planctomycetota bacterium]|jgi:aromatic-amino-acid transaminase
MDPTSGPPKATSNVHCAANYSAQCFLESTPVNPTLTSNPFSALIESVSKRPGDDPIFTLNAEANRRAARGESIVNATLGALISDEGHLVVPPSVQEAYARVPFEMSSGYAPIAGPPTFLKAVIQDTFGDGSLAEASTAVATAGGTGAILHAITTFLDVGQTLLTSDYHWAPYRVIASHTRRAVETFQMFDEKGNFNLRSFEESLVAQLARQGRSLIILNFPCHNPTGYTLTGAEWKELTEIIERHGQKAPVAVLFDIAYAKFGAPGSEHWVERLGGLASSAQILVAWSASKSFAQYGARIGALIAIQHDEAERTKIFNALSYACRSTWSNCNHRGMLAMTKMLTEPDLKLTYANEFKGLVDLLNQRVAKFNEVTAGLDLFYPRYEGGFFVTVFTPNAQITADKMRELGVFVVPFDGAVRLALCAISEANIPRLVEALHSGVRAAQEA